MISVDATYDLKLRKTSPQEVQVVVNAFSAVFFKKGKLYAIHPLYNLSTYLPT